MSVDGYEIPVHQSLQVPILMAGSAAQYYHFKCNNWRSLNLGLAFLFGAFLFVLLLHTVAVFLTKRDSDFFEVIKRFFPAKILL